MFDRAPMFDDMAADGRPVTQSWELLEVEALGVDVSGMTLLDIPALQISSGGPTVIMGPNGAGKSLLLRLLHGLAVPTRGCIRMHEQPLSPRLCRRQAMLFQSPVILRRSVRSNIEYALAAHGVSRRARAGEATKLLDMAGLGGRARQSGRSLSGGEQQKLALLRALATRPEILLLDEPTSNLDPASILAIENLLLNAARAGTKLILVTHDLGQAKRLGDEVIFLHKGRVTEQTPIEIFAKSPNSAEGAAYLSGLLLV